MGNLLSSLTTNDLQIELDQLLKTEVKGKAREISNGIPDAIFLM